MRRVEVENFLSDCEVEEACKWFGNALVNKEDIFHRGEGSGLRKSTRGKAYANFPDVFLKIQERVINSFMMPPGYIIEPTVNGLGIIAVATEPGGYTPAHKDFRPIPGKSVIRFNVILQKPKGGGVLHVEDESGRIIKWDTPVGSLHCYNVTEYTHYVTRTEDWPARYIYLTSIVCDAQDWESGKIAYIGELPHKEFI